MRSAKVTIAALCLAVVLFAMFMKVSTSPPHSSLQDIFERDEDPFGAPGSTPSSRRRRGDDATPTNQDSNRCPRSVLQDMRDSDPLDWSFNLTDPARVPPSGMVLGPGGCRLSTVGDTQDAAMQSVITYFNKARPSDGIQSILVVAMGGEFMGELLRATVHLNRFTHLPENVATLVSIPLVSTVGGGIAANVSALVSKPLSSNSVKDINRVVLKDVEQQESNVSSGKLQLVYVPDTTRLTTDDAAIAHQLMESFFTDGGLQPSLVLHGYNALGTVPVGGTLGGHDPFAMGRHYYVRKRVDPLLRRKFKNTTAAREPFLFAAVLRADQEFELGTGYAVNEGVAREMRQLDREWWDRGHLAVLDYTSLLHRFAFRALADRIPTVLGALPAQQLLECRFGAIDTESSEGAAETDFKKTQAAARKSKKRYKPRVQPVDGEAVGRCWNLGNRIMGGWLLSLLDAPRGGEQSGCTCSAPNVQNRPWVGQRCATGMPHPIPVLGDVVLDPKWLDASHRVICRAGNPNRKCTAEVEYRAAAQACSMWRTGTWLHGPKDPAKLHERGRRLLRSMQGDATQFPPLEALLAPQLNPKAVRASYRDGISVQHDNKEYRIPRYAPDDLIALLHIMGRMDSPDVKSNGSSSTKLSAVRPLVISGDSIMRNAITSLISEIRGHAGHANFEHFFHSDGVYEIRTKGDRLTPLMGREVSALDSLESFFEAETSEGSLLAVVISQWNPRMTDEMHIAPLHTLVPRLRGVPIAPWGLAIGYAHHWSPLQMDATAAETKRMLDELEKAMVGAKASGSQGTKVAVLTASDKFEKDDHGRYVALNRTHYFIRNRELRAWGRQQLRTEGALSGRNSSRAFVIDYGTLGETQLQLSRFEDRLHGTCGVRGMLPRSANWILTPVDGRCRDTEGLLFSWVLTSLFLA